MFTFSSVRDSIIRSSRLEPTHLLDFAATLYKRLPRLSIALWKSTANPSQCPPPILFQRRHFDGFFESSNFASSSAVSTKGRGCKFS